MISSTMSTAGIYLCNLSLPLSNKQGHLHSSRIPLEGSVVLLHTHQGIQPRTWYQVNYRNLSGSARHVEVRPKDHIEELHKEGGKTRCSDHLLHSELLKSGNVVSVF